jgi:hypothetical protein
MRITLKRRGILVRVTPTLVGFFAFQLPAGGQAAPASTPSSSCVLPSGLHDEVAQKYPGAHIVTISDLNEDHRVLFRKDHGTRCPGIVKVDFYGDGKPTWALVLIAGENPKRKAQLVLARQVTAGWEAELLETADGTPVVWREGPGKYESTFTATLQARYPVIVFCGYRSWAILYAWDGQRVLKTWLSD